MAKSDFKKVEVLTLNAKQMAEQLEAIQLFLRLVHPALMEENNKAFVELRGIARDYDGVPFPLRNKSYNTKGMTEKDTEYLAKWLESRNGFPICLYYSVFTYDRWQESFTKAGKKAQGGKITEAAALFAEELPLDFDHMGKEEMEKYDTLLVNAGIAPLWVSSGHGYQAHILLNERVSEQKTLEFLINLFISKGFEEVDPACKDKARLFRLPYSFNCKAFEKKSKYPEERENPPKTEIVKLRTQRYSVDDIVTALNKIPTVDWELNIKALSIYEEGKFVSAKVDREQKIARQTPEYPTQIKNAMNLPKFPESLKMMLNHTPQGYRHDSMALLMMVFNRYLGLSAAASKKALRIWNDQACDPSLDSFDKEFSEMWPGTGKFDLKKLAKQFGFVSLKTFAEEKNRSEIRIPNKLLNNISKVKTTTLKTYVAFAIAEHDGLDGTPQEAAEILGSDYGVARRNAKALVSKGFLKENQGNKSQGIPYTYSISRVSAFNDGYTSIPYEKIRDYLSLSATELALYLLIRRDCLNEADVVANYTVLAKTIGCSEASISRTVKQLKNSGFINVEYRYIDKICHRNAIQLCA